MDRTYDGKALERYEMIAPLLSAGIEAGERRRQRARILENTGISERTLRRYIENYKAHGLAGLADDIRSDKGVTKVIPGFVIDEAVRLREELPERSVRQIIEILEGERLIKPGTVARTTLNEKLVARGMGAKRLKSLSGTRLARRFARKHRNSLWQADLKYGPLLNNGKKKTKTYMLVIIDDKTRMIMHAEFYDNQRLPILEDCFRKALLKYGKPKDILVDNGKIFVSKWFRLACAHLGVRHIKAKINSPETKGKCEKFNQAVDVFIRELALEPVSKLGDLNRKFVPWLDEGYTHQPHGALAQEHVDPETGEIIKGAELTPYQAYTRDNTRIRYATGIECRDAFLWEETRTVDKTGCVKLCGHEFDVGVMLAKMKVDIRYDPFDLSIVEVWRGGKFERRAVRVVIGEWTAAVGQFSGKKTTATHSRLLKVYEERNKQRDKARNAALTFYDKPQVGGEPDDNR